MDPTSERKFCPSTVNVQSRIKPAINDLPVVLLRPSNTLRPKLNCQCAALGRSACYARPMLERANVNTALTMPTVPVLARTPHSAIYGLLLRSSAK